MQRPIHCPRCGTIGPIGQPFCKFCGLPLDKVAALLGDEPTVELSLSIDRALLRTRQRKIQKWRDRARSVTLYLIMLLLVFMPHEAVWQASNFIPRLFMILLVIAAGSMGFFERYSSFLKSKLAKSSLPGAAETSTLEEARNLEGYREPVLTPIESKVAQ